MTAIQSPLSVNPLEALCPYHVLEMAAAAFDDLVQLAKFLANPLLPTNC